MLSLPKLLPINVRNNQRYKDIISVYESYLQNDLKGEIDKIPNRDNFDLISDEDVKNVLFDYGHVLSQGDGYTATSRYLHRELQTMIKRLKSKGTEAAYQQLLYVFDLLGEVYPTILLPDGSLETFLTWLVSDELDPEPLHLDTGLTMDQIVGNTVWTLDYGSFINSITRHFIFSYASRYVENATEFISGDTALAIYNDTLQNKRQVEIPHFEYRLYANANAANTETTRVWTDHPADDGTTTISAIQRSCSMSVYDPYQIVYSDFNNAAYIQFGDGAHSPVDNSITGVQSLIQEIPLSSMQIKLQDATHLYFKNKIFPTTRLYDFREIMVLDAWHFPLFYSTFPWVRFSSGMYSHIYAFLSIS